MSDQDTIFALASGAGRTAIAVIRISGPASAPTLGAMLGSAGRERLPAPRRASLRRLVDPDGEALDRALVLWSPGPASYTGEDTAELHLHGGEAVIDGVTAALVAAGARPAEPGEFSRRAFLNGRMELTEVEAVADLVAAETKAQRVQALLQLDGALGQLLDGWSLRLRTLLARQEARIDFPDEAEEVEASETDAIRVLMEDISEHLDDERRGERLREGLRFAITGAPNVGKSSLLNALAGRDAAIVTPSAGTTRDVIEARMVFGGVPVTLLDTAGVRATLDPIEAEGVRRALAAAGAADLVLALQDARDWRADAAANADARVIHVATKIDLEPTPAATLGVSILDGRGLPELRALLDANAQRLTRCAGPPPLTRARHRAACEAALAHLRDAACLRAAELQAEDLRLAMRALGRVTGRVGVEDLLDTVFSHFCIGK